MNLELAACARLAATEDRAGRAWCKQHGYPGYTSYASLNDLPWRFPVFADLVQQLDRHAMAFARLLEWDLGDRALTLDSLWVNVMPAGGFHSGHIHPNSVISGTYYVETPPGSAAIRFEDPRLAMMQASPPRKSSTKLANRSFDALAPRAGEVLMWESWLRHEVPLHPAKADRISVSFNYAWR